MSNRSLSLCPLFDNHEITIPIPPNDRALGEVLISALSAMVRAFPTNGISVLMVSHAILGQTIMVRGTTDLDHLPASFGNAGASYVNVVLVITNRADSLRTGGFHRASHTSEKLLGDVTFSPTSNYWVAYN